MAKVSQKNRLLAITTPLGEDFLLINKMHVEEKMSELFEIDVEVLYDELEDDAFDYTVIDDTQILGKTATISITQRDGAKRTLTGMINNFTLAGRNRRFTSYYMTVVPHVWRLSQSLQSRIFQHLSVPDILKKVFKGYEVKYQLVKNYNPRNYCVQYQESDFAFASRLMEEEGIGYFFEHTPEMDKLVVCDDFKTPADCPSKSTIGIVNEDLTGEIFESAVKEWRIDYQLQSGKRVLWDHHFQLPLKKLDAEQTSIFNAGQNKEIEIYNYPGGYAKKYDESNGDLGNIFTDNKATVKNRIKSLDTQYKTTSGASDCCTLTTGYRFTLQNHPNKDFNKQYMFVAVTHNAEQSPDYLVGDVLPRAYENEFVCLPLGAGQPEYCPPVTTPKPRMFGSQTATVVGPAGEEIYTDKYGRIKVQFHWDRDGKYDPNSSCWMRVVQPWAGRNWGTICIPRIGHEVVVEFLEGDPDQPIVSGAVYNPANMPPYTLPENAHTMGFKSDSTKGSGGYNELAIIDDKGKELFRINAQKDMDTKVLNDDRQHVIANRTKKVDGWQQETVKGDKTSVVSEGNKVTKVEAGNQTNTTEAGSHSNTAAVQNVMAVGSDGAGGCAVQGSITIKDDGTIDINALTKITLSVGGSSITIEDGHIVINSPLVDINP